MLLLLCVTRSYDSCFLTTSFTTPYHVRPYRRTHSRLYVNGGNETNTLDGHAAVTQLEKALQANDIDVPQGAVQCLLDQRDWIYKTTERIETLLEELSEEQLYSVFNYQHHLYSSAKLFEFLSRKRKKVSVVYGHKAQGKTQFLFFVFKLLQAMGEKVLFLDKTIMPLDEDDDIDIDSAKFCGHLWKDSFLQMNGSVKTSLNKFYEDGRPESFGKFIKALRQNVRNNGTRIWIIVDEVVLFEKFPISLPEEQDLGPFNWIVTGSAGIGSWVAKRHLEKLVFDLPLFTNDECLGFANRLCSELNVNLEDTIGVPPDGIDDWLEERFGGVVGYIAEMVLEISRGNTVSQYLSSLEDRMNEIVSNVAKRRHISEEQLSSVWLKDIKSGSNRWSHLRDAGLCGSQSPRGVIFSLILQCLYKYAPGEDALSLVTLFRSKFSGDPGLDGCLLELEEILKLRASRSMKASLLKYINQGWIVDQSIELPPTPTSLNVLVYDEIQSKLEPILPPNDSSWNLIEVPRGFVVVDVILVNTRTGSQAIYGIQITRSSKPSAKHHTFDTCSKPSLGRLTQLWGVISRHFKLDDAVKKFYVMLAPNCEGNQFKPPANHSSDYYFSPTSVITEYSSSDSKRRSSQLGKARSPKKENKIK